MTEAEWLASTDPKAMLRLLLDPFAAAEAGLLKQSVRPGDRKLRLFACAAWRFGRRIDEEFARDLALAERIADEGGEPPDSPRTVLLPDAIEAAQAAAEHASFQTKEGFATTPALASLLRDVVGSPHRPVTLYVSGNGSGEVSTNSSGDGPWWPLTPDVLALADGAYRERLPGGTLDPARLAVLADALEEAGCDNEALLTHLRSECVPGMGPCDIHPYAATHVRGCWAVDLLSGKE